MGASCPPDRLRALLALLRPEGGKIITPVCNDLRLISVNAEGEVKQERISQVRYSDLEVMALVHSLSCVLDRLKCLSGHTTQQSVLDCCLGLGDFMQHCHAPACGTASSCERYSEQHCHH